MLVLVTGSGSHTTNSVRSLKTSINHPPHESQGCLLFPGVAAAPPKKVVGRVSQTPSIDV